MIKFNEIIDKCYLEIDRDYQLFLGLKKQENKTIETLKDYLKLTHVKSEKSAQFSAIFQKKHHKKNSDIINKYIEISNDRNIDKTELESWFYSHRALDKLQGESFLISHLIEGEIAILNKDMRWLKRVTIELGRIHPDLLAIEFNSMDFKETSMIHFQKALEASLKSFQIFLKDKKLFVCMMLNLSELFQSSQAISNTLSKFSFKLSLKEIREYSKSHYYSGLFPLLWYRELKSRASTREADFFINKVMKRISVSHMKDYEFIIFKNYFPKKPSDRELIIKKILSFKDHKSIQLQHILFETLEIDIIKHELSQLDPYFLKPTFQIQRKMALSHLDKGQSIYYNLYRLFKLGSFDKELLWWQIL